MLPTNTGHWEQKWHQAIYANLLVGKIEQQLTHPKIHYWKQFIDDTFDLDIHRTRAGKECGKD